MKINFTVKEKPYRVTFDMYSDRKDFIDNVVKSGELNVLVDQKTKTAISTMLQKDRYLSYYYSVPRAVTNLKYLIREERCSIRNPYRKTQRAYFKVSASQKFEAYKKYLTAIIQDMFYFYDIEELNVNVMTDEETRRMLGIEENMVH